MLTSRYPRFSPLQWQSLFRHPDSWLAALSKPGGFRAPGNSVRTFHHYLQVSDFPVRTYFGALGRQLEAQVGFQLQIVLRANSERLSSQNGGRAMRGIL